MRITLDLVSMSETAALKLRILLRNDHSEWRAVDAINEFLERNEWKNEEWKTK